MSLRKKITKFRSLSTSERGRLLLYPVYLVWEMPIAWAKSLVAARILLNGQWERYMGFHPQNALNSFFYRTQWLNLNRYGRSGISPVVGLGNYPLSNWFQIALPASYFYANAGAATTLGGTLVWVFSHLIWLDRAETMTVLILTLLLFFSSTAYAMAFRRQNYQILGWMWLPLALYGLLNGQWILATFAWLAASFAGITYIFYAGPIVVLAAYEQESWWPVITAIPAVLKVLSQFLPLALHPTSGASLTATLKLIGAKKKSVRYHRNKRWTQFETYFIALYSSGAIVLWLYQGSCPGLLLLGIFAFALNQRVMRVADEQSVIVLFCSLWSAYVLSVPSGWVELLTSWTIFAVWPVYLLLTDIAQPVRAIMPYDHTRIKSAFEDFFSPVSADKRVLMAFADPAGSYSKVFDGYRVLIELPLFVCAKKGVHLMPDWYAVALTNTPDSQTFWGRDQQSVSNNMKKYNAEYCVLYSDVDNPINWREWKEFEILKEFDWTKFDDTMRAVLGRDSKQLQWYLAKMTDQHN